VTGIVGAFVEAWAELRIHRTRVLLSLIGVAVAVAALTSVVGLGAITQQATTETYERQSGRPATLFVTAYNATTGESPDAATLSTAFFTVTDRYSVDWTTRSTYTQVSLDFVEGLTPVDTMVVDVDYGTMHRVQLVQGSWFAAGDERRLAPALVVNETVWKRLGSPDLSTHPTVTIGGAEPVVAVVVGVVADQPFVQDYATMFMLYDSYVDTATPQQVQSLFPQFEAWVPPGIAEELSSLIRRDIAGELGEGWQLDVNRQDYLVYQGEDPLLSIKLLVGGVAVLVLLLGALGLVNISLVTVRQRIREIGIRRSFGATAGRVFFAVMMESVVAAGAAGVVGVFVAVLVVRNPAVIDFIAFGLTDVPAFPLEAALVGLGAATFVGALAGLLPALVAVRVKVIDAIRY
jgi:putative ABC transport system permease protein